MIENHNQFIESLEKQMRTYLEQVPYSEKYSFHQGHRSR